MCEFIGVAAALLSAGRLAVLHLAPPYLRLKTTAIRNQDGTGQEPGEGGRTGGGNYRDKSLEFIATVGKEENG